MKKSDKNATLRTYIKPKMKITKKRIVAILCILLGLIGAVVPFIPALLLIPLGIALLKEKKDEKT